jgi:hypothetical protein
MDFGIEMSGLPVAASLCEAGVSRASDHASHRDAATVSLDCEHE